MLEWLKNNYPTLIICILVFGAVAAVVAKMIYNKMHHIPSCSSCGSCPMAGNCEKNNAGADKKLKAEKDRNAAENGVNTEDEKLTVKYGDALNRLLESDGFQERFGASYREQRNGKEYCIISIEHLHEKNKKIDLCVTGVPALTFLHNFYDDEDLGLSDAGADEDITPNLYKLYNLLKPILSNEIISVSGKCAGRGFGAICTEEQLKSNSFTEEKGYSELKFEMWNGEPDEQLIASVTSN